MSGSATLTTVTSISSMKVPQQIAVSGSHLRMSSPIGAAFGQVQRFGPVERDGQSSLRAESSLPGGYDSYSTAQHRM